VPHVNSLKIDGLDYGHAVPVQTLPQHLVIRKRFFAESAALLGNCPDLGTLAATDQLRSGNGSIDLSPVHPMHHLTVLVHPEPPVTHLESYTPSVNVAGSTRKLITWSEILF